RLLREYERRASRLVTFGHVLLFQLAVPSEIPGYVLGLTGCRFRTFVAAVALGELPYAIGAVYLGESFLQRNYVLLFTIGIAGIALSWAAFRLAAATWTSDRDADRHEEHEEHVVIDGSGSERSASIR
ncbi:MAG: VTT domain-containing protein, partial [Thermoanaerobaculia bacterium]